jgi:hypothetical protein
MKLSGLLWDDTTSDEALEALMAATDDDPCQHDSASGTGEPDVERCDSCSATWRVVRDDDGPIHFYPGSGEPAYRIRQEPMPS